MEQYQVVCDTRHIPLCNVLCVCDECSGAVIQLCFATDEENIWCIRRGFWIDKSPRVPDFYWQIVHTYDVSIIRFSTSEYKTDECCYNKDKEACFVSVGFQVCVSYGSKYTLLLF